MKKYLLFILMLSGLYSSAQAPIDHTRENRILTNRATQERYYLGIPAGPTPYFPSYVPDSLKVKALFMRTGNTEPGLKRWNGTEWVGVGNSISGIQQIITTGADSAGLKWAANTDYAQIYFRSVASPAGMGTSSLNFLVGDDKFGSGAEEKFLFQIDTASTIGATKKIVDLLTIGLDGIYFKNQTLLTSADAVNYPKLDAINYWTGTNNFQNITTNLISGGSGPTAFALGAANPQFGYLRFVSDGSGGTESSKIEFNYGKANEKALTYSPVFYGDYRLHWGADALAYKSDIAGGAVIDSTFNANTYLSRSGGVMSGDIILPNTQPTNANQAVPKFYIDNLITGISWKNAARVKTTANITLSGLQTIDGVALAAGNRVLVNNQTSPAQNGIYLVSGAAWTRVTDADAPDEIQSATIAVTAGTANKNTQWTYIGINEPVIGTDAISFGQISGAGTYANGTGINLSANVFSLNTTYTNTLYPQLAGSYANPAWITSLDWSKLINTPTSVAGYGITDVYSKTQSDAGFVNTTGNQSAIAGNKVYTGSGTWGGLLYVDVPTPTTGNITYLKIGNTFPTQLNFGLGRGLNNDLNNPNTFLNFGNSQIKEVAGIGLVLKSGGTQTRSESDFVPSADNTKNLGSTGLRWNALNIGTGASIFGGTVTTAQYKLSALNTAPASATDTGVVGDIRVTAGYIYLCTASNTWVRTALSTF